jgi:branched-chain amino acid transport system substrate-binding protein
MRRGILVTAVTAFGALALAQVAAAATGQVVIGDLDDMSGVYADVMGAGGVEAMNMAIADFGGTVLGRKIITLTADHQNKPDVGASKFREWADQNGLNMLLGGSNTGVNIAMAKVAAAKQVPFFSIGAGGASLTNEDCTAYTVHYVYDTTALANGTATAVVSAGGKNWYYLTADYAFGTQLQRPRWSKRTAARTSAACACRWALRTSPRSCCRRRAPVRRCSGWPTPAPISVIR